MESLCDEWVGASDVEVPAGAADQGPLGFERAKAGNHAKAKGKGKSKSKGKGLSARKWPGWWAMGAVGKGDFKAGSATSVAVGSAGGAAAAGAGSGSGPAESEGPLLPGPIATRAGYASAAGMPTTGRAGMRSLCSLAEAVRDEARALIQSAREQQSRCSLEMVAGARAGSSHVAWLREVLCLAGRAADVRLAVDGVVHACAAVAGG